MTSDSRNNPDQAAKAGFMRRAIELAYEAMDSGSGRPFGAVIVRDGEIVAEGHNETLRRIDPTAHAEIVTIGRATKALGRLDISDCEIYVNGMPCPMCMTALYRARIGKLYYGCPLEDAFAVGLDDPLYYEELAKPLDERSLPAEHVKDAHEEARACFHTWRDKQDNPDK